MAKIIKRMNEGNKQYGIIFSIDECKFKSIFINTDKLYESDMEWININNLNNEEFLQKYNIEYIIENNHIIPIGLVDFINGDRYTLHVICSHGKNLYLANQIISNIEKAIKLKYEVVKFKERFKYPLEVIEETQL